MKRNTYYMDEVVTAEKVDVKYFKRLLSRIVPYKKLFLLSFLLLACSSLIALLPPFLILSVISLFYTQFRDNWVVNLVLRGMQAGVAAVICDVVVTMSRSILQLRRILPVLMLIGAFIASWVFSINIIYIILFCAVVGALDTWHREKNEKSRKEEKKP